MDSHRPQINSALSTIGLLIAVLLLLHGSTSAAGYIGSPSSSNGWSCTSAITATNSDWITASDRGAVNLINGSGMGGTDGLTCTNISGVGGYIYLAWDYTVYSTDQRAYSAQVPQKFDNSITRDGCWMAFTFDQVYTVGNMLIWNFNNPTVKTDYVYLDWGMKAVTIAYSTDKTNWTYIDTILTRAPGTAAYNNPDSIPINANAKYVVLMDRYLYTGTQYWQSGGAENPGINFVGTGAGATSKRQDIALDEVRFEKSAKAIITSPTAGTTLVGPTAGFSWTTGSDLAAIPYRLTISSTSQGNTDVYDSGWTTSTSKMVTTLTTNAGTAYIRLQTKFSDDSTLNDDKTYIFAKRASITSPSNGSALPNPTVVFSRDTATGGLAASPYRLTVGSAAGGTDYYDSGWSTASSFTVTNLPVDCSYVYARLQTKYATGETPYKDYTYWSGPNLSQLADFINNWLNNNCGNQYDLNDDCIVNFTDFVLFTKFSVASTAEITRPIPGSILKYPNVLFQWTSAADATEYHLSVGTTEGGTNIFNASCDTNTSQFVSITLNNNPVYVKLSANILGSWVDSYYIYRAGSGTGSVNQPAFMTSPLPGQDVNTTGSVVFNWTAGSGVTQYRLSIGSTAGGIDYFNDTVAGTSKTISSIPLNNSHFYVTLGSMINSQWVDINYVYKAMKYTLNSYGYITQVLPTIVAPADYYSIGGVTSATLRVNMIGSGPMTVTFYGREVSDTNDFRIVVIPDTQYNVADATQTTAAVNLHPAAILHVGDITQKWNDPVYQSEWSDTSTRYQNTFENPSLTGISGGLPYLLCMGNHDWLGQYNNSVRDAGAPLFAQYFGESRYTGKYYWGGCYGGNGSGSPDEAAAKAGRWIKFSGGGMNFVALAAPYSTTGGIISDYAGWANSQLSSAENKNKRAIIVVHSLIGNLPNTIRDPGEESSNEWTSTSWGNGQQTYNSLKGNSNLFLMICGHMTGDAQRIETDTAYRMDIMMFDYQAPKYVSQGPYANEDGWLRVLEFSPSTNQIHARTFNSHDNIWDSGNRLTRFTIPYNMGGSPPEFELKGQNTGVSSGANTSIIWSGLSANKTYEWYVEVNDNGQHTKSDVWRFNTKP